MDNWNYMQKLAFILLADATASVLDSCEETDSEVFDHPRQTHLLKALRDEVLFPQSEICSQVAEVCEERGVDPTKYLPTDLVEAHIKQVDRLWAGRGTVRELYEECQEAAERLIIGAAGHGVQLGDDEEDIQWLKERKIDEGEHRKAGYICDSYYEQGYDLVYELIKSSDSDEESICDECGDPFFATADGINHHGAPGEVDHDLDGDHVPYKR